MLHLDVCGRGPDLVLVHGWGMHGGIWSDWAEQLGRCFRVHRVDLPGHGHSSRYRCGNALTDWAAAVAQATPPQAWWLGWSLGGLVSLEAARSQARSVRGLVLLASTPKFVASPGWKAGVDAAVFELFAQQLEINLERTLTRFLSLEVRNAERSGETLRHLRAGLKRRPWPDRQALRDGLGFLQDTDMRDALDQVNVPVYGLLGGRDTLVPARVADTLGDRCCAVVEGAGHAPFLSHPEQCSEQLRRWLLTDKTGRCHAAG